MIPLFEPTSPSKYIGGAQFSPQILRPSASTGHHFPWNCDSWLNWIMSKIYPKIICLSLQWCYFAGCNGLLCGKCPFWSYSVLISQFDLLFASKILWHYLAVRPLSCWEVCNVSLLVGEEWTVYSWWGICSCSRYDISVGVRTLKDS